MAAPKSVVKVKKDGIEYVSSVDRAQYTIKELSRAALRDVAKLVRKRVKGRAPKRPMPYGGNLKKNIGTWVRGTKGGIPYLQIGLYNRKTAHKKGLIHAFWGSYIELGTKKQKARPFIKPTVFALIPQIRKIQAQYLSAIDKGGYERYFKEGEELE